MAVNWQQNLQSNWNIPQQLIDGRRITDTETLKIVTMVYAGYINKNIVAALQSNECNAIGLNRRRWQFDTGT